MSDKPREWYIGSEASYPCDDFSLEYIKDEYDDKIIAHVIEYSAYEKLKSENEDLMRVDYWQDRHNIVVKENERLKADRDEQASIAMQAIGDYKREKEARERAEKDSAHWFEMFQERTEERNHARDQFTQLKEKLNQMQEAKDLLVDRLAEFTIGKEINGGECLLINKLQPEVDQLKEKLAVAKEALEFYANDTHWVARDGGGGLRVEGYDCEDSPFWGFSGRRARKALKKLGSHEST